ncbi:hypothetical protein [Dickeya sp. CFBP 2040]|uniref:hypothetical protein n=1 Tax=Dickeya sp. CFBP 2040 TaxID=2718531 RepID=UPI001B300042|nr:hypothetical protein [Dickeya sp. CFBP 2040]
MVLILCIACLYFSYHFFQPLNNKANVICNLLEAVEQGDFSLRGSTQGRGMADNNPPCGGGLLR